MTTNQTSSTAVDSVAPPPNLIPAKPGGEWDDPAGEQSARPAPEVEEIEDDQTWGTDPGDADRAAATDFVDEPETEVPAEQEQPAQQTQPAVRPDDDEEEEDPAKDLAQFGQGAQQRIRELNDKRKAAEARASELEKTFQQFLLSQQKQQAIQEQFLQEELATRQTQQTAATRARTLEQYKALGFDETNVGHWLAFDAIQKAEAAAQTAQAQAQALQQERVQAQQQAYVNELHSQLTRSLQGKDGTALVPPATAKALFEQAYAIAATRQLANPADAVAAVVAPILPLLRPRAAKPSKAPDPNDARFAVMAASGRGAGQAPGTSASGRKPKRDVEELERLPWTKW